MRKVRALLLSAILALVALGGLAPAPAHACTGDVCDSFCDSIRDLNDKLPPKLKLTDCQLR
jgi:hypothetical protein